MPVHPQLAFPLTLARSSFTSHVENRLSPNHVSYFQNRTAETSKSDRLLVVSLHGYGLAHVFSRLLFHFN
jgi:hypothetical protein